MASSSLVFRSSMGPWAVLTCACECGDSVVIWDDQLGACKGPPRFYVRHHQPLGCLPDRVGERWDYAYDPQKDFEAPRPQEPALESGGDEGRALETADAEGSLEPDNLEWPDDLDQYSSLDSRLFYPDYDTKP